MTTLTKSEIEVADAVISNLNSRGLKISYRMEGEYLKIRTISREVFFKNFYNFMDFTSGMLETLEVQRMQNV